MQTFYIGGQFPSFKPIRTKAENILLLVDDAIMQSNLPKDEEYLKTLKERAATSPADKLFYFTIKEAKLVGIL